MAANEKDPTAPGAPPEAEVPGAPAEAGARAFVTDAVRKAVLTGLGAVFLTEEGARKLARDWKLPKEIAAYVTTQASSARDEIVRVVSDEVRKFFESEALRREFLRLLGSMSVEVRAEINFKPSEAGRLTPEVKIAGARPKVKRSRVRRHDEPPEPEPPAE